MVQIAEVPQTSATDASVTFQSRMGKYPVGMNPMPRTWNYPMDIITKKGVHTNSNFLTPEQCDKIVANLDECIILFEQKPGLLTGHELRAKSLFKVLRNEISLHSAAVDDRTESTA